MWAFVGVVRANYGCGGYEINCIFKKKLTYGPNDASSVVWALFHLCFIFVGLRWPSLADVGLCGRRPGQLWVWWVRNKLYIQKKNSPMAQTTHLASFGPFFIFVSSS